MNFLIVADSDQAGASGVGDYALLIAESLKSRNFNVTFETLGPPDSLSRFSFVKRLQQAQPDWVSFHFVPYAYAHRGLVGRRTLPWKALRGRIGTHILFHEIWIGAHQGASWRQRASGLIQRFGIQAAMHDLRPDVVHCTNTLYSAMLKKAGISNKVLPLFGAVPVVSGGFDPYPDLLRRLVPGSNRIEWVVAAMFGTMHPTDNLLVALNWLGTKCQSRGQHLLLVSLGHCPTATPTFNALASYFSEPATPFFHVTGKLDSSSLSSWILGADCGFATTPFNIIDKSSSAVAFVEHGIPVIVMDAGAPIPGIPHQQPDHTPEFWLLGDSRLDLFDGLPPRREPSPRRDFVVNQFLDDLNNYAY